MQSHLPAASDSRNQETHLQATCTISGKFIDNRFADSFAGGAANFGSNARRNILSVPSVIEQLGRYFSDLFWVLPCNSMDVIQLQLHGDSFINAKYLLSK
jgi:hypothetical protein